VPHQFILRHLFLLFAAFLISTHLQAGIHSNEKLLDSTIYKNFIDANQILKELQEQNKNEEALKIIEAFKINGTKDSNQLFYENLLQANYYINSNQYDNAQASCKTSLQYARNFKYHSQPSLIENKYAILLLNQKKIDLAQPFVESALQHAESAHDTLMIGKSYETYSLFYNKTRDDENHMKYLLKALDITLSTESNQAQYEQLAGIYTSLSRQYDVQNYPDKALEYGKIAHRLYKESNNNRGLARICQAIQFNRLLTKEQRIQYCKEGIETSSRCGWYEYMQTFHYNTAIYYSKLNNMDSCKHYFYKAKKLNFKIEGSGAKNDLQNAMYDATVIIEPDSAIALLNKYEQESTEDQKKSASWNKRFYYRKATLMAALKKYDSAYSAYTRYKSVSDSIQSKEFVEATEKLNIQFETTRKENEILLLKKENDLQSLTISNKNILFAKQELENLKQRQNLLIKDLELKNKNKSLAIIKAEREKKEQELVLVNNDILTKSAQLASLEQLKRNQELKIKQKLIEQENKRIQEKKNLWIGFLIFAGFASLILLFFVQKNKQRMQQKNYESIIESIEQERNRISNDLHDDIGSTLSSIAIYNELINDKVKTKPEIVPQLSEKISVQINNLMRHTEDIIWSLKIGQNQHETISKRIQEYATELLHSKNIHATIEIDNDVEDILQHPEQRRNMLMIIKEAMNNCRKYSKANQFTIKMSIQDKQVILILKDDGIGFDINNIVFGDGILNIQNRCKHLNGKCEINSTVGEGTSIYCTMPISSYLK